MIPMTVIAKQRARIQTMIAIYCVHILIIDMHFKSCIYFRRLKNLVLIALYRFKWLVDSRKLHSILTPTFSVHSAHNNYCNRVMRSFIVKLRRKSSHKQRVCSSIYKWRHSLLQTYISLWLKQTKVNVRLKQFRFSRISRRDSGSSFAKFKNRLELSRCRRLILNVGNGFRRRYLLRSFILRWRANMSFSRCCRLFLQSVDDDIMVINLAKKRVWNRWRILSRSLHDRTSGDRQHKQVAMMHYIFRLQRVTMLRWLRRLTARYRHHAVIKPAISRFLLHEGRQRRLYSHLKSWELYWLFRTQFVRAKNRLAIQQYNIRLISRRWPTFRVAVAARQGQIRASLRAEFYRTCVLYSKGIRALKLLLPSPPITQDGGEGLRRQLLRGKLRAILFWKAWRCSKCLAKWRVLCLHLRRRREQLRAAWAEFERDTARSTCRTIVRVATCMEDKDSERSAVLKKVLFTWKKAVTENKLLKYRSQNVEASRQNLFGNRSIGRVGRVGAAISVPLNILSQERDTQEVSQYHDQSVAGSRDQPRRSLPPPVSLPLSSSEFMHGPTISSLLSSSSSRLHDEAFERWRVPPRNPVFAAPIEAEKNRSPSLLSFQTAVNTNSDVLSQLRSSKLLDFERSRSEGDANGQTGSVSNSELRKQLASEVLILIKEIGRCI